MAQPHIFEGTREQLAEHLAQLSNDKRYGLVELTEEQREPTAEEIAAADARLLSHAVDIGYATGLDNECIDADLAREYGNDHAVMNDKALS